MLKPSIRNSKGTDLQRVSTSAGAARTLASQTCRVSIFAPKPTRWCPPSVCWFRTLTNICNRYMYVCIYIYGAPPCTYPFCTFTGIYGVFCIFWGIYVFNVFSNKFGHSFEGEYHIYIYNRGCRQTCET